MPQPKISEAEFAIFIQRAGFVLTPEQIAEYYSVYSYVEEMGELIRSTPRSYMAEPAHIYGFEQETAS